MKFDILLDMPLDGVNLLIMEQGDGKLTIVMSKIFKAEEKDFGVEQFEVFKEVHYRNYLTKELESGGNEVSEEDRKHCLVKPLLRKMGRR